MRTQLFPASNYVFATRVLPGNGLWSVEQDRDYGSNTTDYLDDTLYARVENDVGPDRDVEEALYAHGDVIEAAVRVREGSVLSGAVMIALRTQKLGAFKTPDRIDFLPELPKGPSGKIRRLKLLELT